MLLLAVLAVEVLHRPARIAFAILVHQTQHFIDRGAARRNLPQPQIEQPVQTVALVASALAPKLPLRYVQQIGGLLLCQPTLGPAVVHLFKAHGPDLL